MHRSQPLVSVTVGVCVAVVSALAAAATLSAPGAAAAAPVAAVGPSAALACPAVPSAELSQPRTVRYGASRLELEQLYLDDRTGLKAQGYRPTRITGYRSGSQQRFATIWVRSGGEPWLAYPELTASGFDSLYRQVRQTHRPVDVSGYNTPSGAVRFASVWERNPSRVEWKLHYNVSRAGMQAYVDQYSRTGWLPLRVEGYRRNGNLNYVTTWLRGSCAWRMHNRMTRSEYQQRLDSYAPGFRLVHLDSFVDGGTVYFAGIWWQRPGAAPRVRSDRDWYLFQRELHNSRCQGRELDNLYVTDVPGTIRYGGIWLPSGAPPADATSSLRARISREVECAPGRAGAAVFNLTTGEQVLVNADTAFGTSSTIKSAILYAVLRRIDATAATLDTRVDSGTQYGANQAGSVTPNISYRIRDLATVMIMNSNNWATNRLIDWVGRARINQELDALGLSQIRLRRYMNGAGAPSTRGNTGPVADYLSGTDNTATPRQYATFLQFMHTNAGGLSATSLDFFWGTLGINRFAHNGFLRAGVDSNWEAFATLFEKAGNNTRGNAPTNKPQLGAHLQRSTAGRIVLANGQVIVYAAFVDEADSPNAGPLQNMLSCIVVHAVREYVPRTTGANLGGCQAG
jgi:hypothetical protein